MTVFRENPVLLLFRYVIFWNTQRGNSNSRCSANSFTQNRLLPWLSFLGQGAGSAVSLLKKKTCFTVAVLYQYPFDMFLKKIDKLLIKNYASLYFSLNTTKNLDKTGNFCVHNTYITFDWFYFYSPIPESVSAIRNYWPTIRRFSNRGENLTSLCEGRRPL